MSKSIGCLYGIGLGPGDSELITKKGLNILEEVPVISFPEKKKGEESYALKIINKYIEAERKLLLNLEFPMVKDKSTLEKQWIKAVEEIWEHLKNGKDVAFLTEGDSLLYSTFIYLDRYMKKLHPEVKIVAVPGISSIFGSAASLGISLADNDDILAIVPANDDKERMRKAIAEHDTIIFIKIAKVLDQTIDLLREMDLLHNAAVVTKATSDEEQVWTNLEEIEGKKIPYLSLMVVKKRWE